MGINTNLNIDPYFDDFDETKQFNRILFKPARAVQARELTQLQTILQKQVERFGTNIYQEGTIISGINITERPDVRYVKLNDQFDFTDPSLYEPTEDTKYYAVGQTSGLRAEILKTANGFQTQAPNLKTFFVKYLNSNLVGGTPVQDFIQGEFLTIEDQDGVQVTTSTSNGISPLRIAVASVADHVGASFGISTEEGILYQKGHFVYSEPQFIIISKYTNVPNNISVGFRVEESIVNSNQDSSLLDNAQGYNNFNAPGADRLKLTPILTSYPSGNAPEGFFALMRFEGGNAITIRDVTQFNSIAKEMAKRTFDESGNYVVSGFDVSLEQNQVGYNGAITHAVVEPGKAYVFGYEVKNNATRKLSIDLVTEKKTKQNQATGVDYGSYYEFDWNGDGGNTILNYFLLDGTRYNLKDSGDNVIGTCSVKNVKAGSATQMGRIYVYAVKKSAGEEDTPIAKIGDTPIVGGLKRPNSGSMIFKASTLSIGDMNSVNITRRLRKNVGAVTTVTLAKTDVETPLTNNIVAVNASNEFVEVTNTYYDGNDVIVELAEQALYVYHDAIVNNVERDSLQQSVTYVKTTVTDGIGNLGIPNVIRLLQVIDNNGSGNDVTYKFRFVNNQKEGFYDFSYIKLKPGETLENSNVLVKFIALKRNSNFGNSFLNAGSYDGVAKHLLLPYTGYDGVVYDHLNSIDFRPYVTPLVPYATDASSAQTVSTTLPNSTIAFRPVVPVSFNSNVFYDFSYYLPRIDSVGISADGEVGLYTGTPAEIPSPQRPKDVYVIADIFIPGNVIGLKSTKSPSVKSVATKNYTMRDIENLDRRVTRLTEAVALSLLEADTNNLFIPDENGLNRFKNGILVDSFRSLRIADLKDPEYSTAVDRLNQVATPKIDQFMVDLKVLNGSSVDLSFSDVVTLASSGSMVNFISQPNATSTRRPSTGAISYRGVADIYPQYNSDYDMIATPDVKLNVLGSIIETQAGTDSSVDGIINYGADGSEPSTANTPPTTTESEVVGEGSGSYSDIKKTWYSRYANRSGDSSSWWESRSKRYSSNKSNDEEEDNAASVSDIISDGSNGLDVQAGTGVDISGFKLNFGTAENGSTNLGPYLIDFSLKPYINSRQIRIYATGLRPNTRHFFYLSEKDVTYQVLPATATPDGSGNVNARRCVVSGNFGERVFTNANGELFAVLAIPAATFPVGEHDLVITDSPSYRDINATATSYTQVKYRAYDFRTETQSIDITTRTLDIQSEGSITTKTVTNKPKPKPTTRNTYTPDRDSNEDDGGTNFSFIDVDGDGRGDFNTVSQAESAGFYGNDGIRGNYDRVGQYSRSDAVQGQVDFVSENGTGDSSPNSSGGGGCFLTTAIVERRGEADDGPTLAKLRWYRDVYMANQIDLRPFIEEYYQVAPKIVNAIGEDSSTWDWVENQIDGCIELIDSGEMGATFVKYRGMVDTLKQKYNIYAQ